MPHLLIAGSTGSGKSVCINSIIMSILFKFKPEEVKLMLVDPKVVELGIYNGLPQLVVPVVNDAKKAAGALGWAVTEMLRRYNTFAQHGAKDIASFNRIVRDMDNVEKYPHIVIVVDELSDLMMAAPAEVEDSICRLAQMARAAGMHLIIATQRPSVDVITGIIKANIPSRIAFATSSQVDSRTILDMGGAEKLLGAGDMLFSPIGAGKPQRVQGCYVSEDEIARVVDFIKRAGRTTYDQQIIEEIDRHTPVGKSAPSASSGPESDEDPMLDAAIE
jgi:S-DNA-T family DNA segregation ATPase FtsK/SpoIIIE